MVHVQGVELGRSRCAEMETRGNIRAGGHNLYLCIHKYICIHKYKYKYICMSVNQSRSRCAVKVRNQGQHTLAGIMVHIYVPLCHYATMAGIIIMGKPPLTGERE